LVTKVQQSQISNRKLNQILKAKESQIAAMLKKEDLRGDKLKISSLEKSLTEVRAKYQVRVKELHERIDELSTSLKKKNAQPSTKSTDAKIAAKHK
jgi:hypothetical protein